MDICKPFTSFTPSYSKASQALFYGVLVALLAFYWFQKIAHSQSDHQLSQQLIASPAVGDIYFLDFRLMSDNLRPNEIYRLATVADITGDIITLRYGDFFYNQQKGSVNAIRYGHLTYLDYFSVTRHDFTNTEISQMFSSGAIYLVKRPFANQLYGRYVIAKQPTASSNNLIPGKAENNKAMAYLRNQSMENNVELAFTLLEESARYGYAIGQVNLADLYLTEHFGDKARALYWLKQAALQSHKPAILKYAIVCKQQTSCDIASFYDDLLASGVNLSLIHI